MKRRGTIVFSVLFLAAALAYAARPNLDRAEERAAGDGRQPFGEVTVKPEPAKDAVQDKKPAQAGKLASVKAALTGIKLQVSETAGQIPGLDRGASPDVKKANRDVAKKMAPFYLLQLAQELTWYDYNDPKYAVAGGIIIALVGFAFARKWI